MFLVNLTSFSQTEQDTTHSVQTLDSTFVMEKSAWGAVLRSAIIPGFGQFYNESYWKVPVVWGFIGYFAYVWIDNNKSYKSYSVRYSETLLNDPRNTELLNGLKEYRDIYRDQRDEFAIYIGLTYFLQLVDAFVDAHLFDFNVTPDPLTKAPQLGIRIHL